MIFLFVILLQFDQISIKDGNFPINYNYRMDNLLKNKLKLGTIGFGYQDWNGEFYPSGMPTRDYLRYYSRNFNAVEIDTTFYGSPKAETVHRWISDAKNDFIFCIKMPRSITHQMGLIGTRGLVSEFCDAARLFGDKLGVILIQLPPRFTADSVNVLDTFLRELPNDFRFAVEFRDVSWYTKTTEKLLTKHNICWVITEYPSLPMDIRRTSEFLYIRWIGKHGSYDHHTFERKDMTSQLEWWWDQIISHLGDINLFYGFFNNDYAGYAVGTSKKFKKLVGITEEEEMIPKQERLF